MEKRGTDPSIGIPVIGKAEEYYNMTASKIMNWRVPLTELLATIVLILTAFGLMLGIVKPAEILKRLSVIVGIIIALMLAPGTRTVRLRSV
jgi:hypothetical protein